MTNLVIPERDDSPYQIVVDNSELSDYTHNRRCYFWSHVLGLEPPRRLQKRAELEFGNALHAALARLYFNDFDPRDAADYALRGVHGELLEAYAIADDFHTPGYLYEVLQNYVDDPMRRGREKHWLPLRAEEWHQRPIGSTIAYGGKLDLIVIDQHARELIWNEHKSTTKRVDSQDFANRHANSMQVKGYHWLCKFLTELWKEQGLIAEDLHFGGVYVNGLQCTKTIKGKNRGLPCFRQEYEIQQFLLNAYNIASDIVRTRELTERYAAEGIPPEHAWPNWPTYSEQFCGWRSLNEAPTEEELRGLLAETTVDPWWVRRQRPADTTHEVTT